MTYRVSKDYKRLKQLLDDGSTVVCFVDSKIVDLVTTDVTLGQRIGANYIISCNGGGRYAVYPSWMANFTDEWFYKRLEHNNVQFIDPDYERNTLELVIKKYETN